MRNAVKVAALVVASLAAAQAVSGQRVGAPLSGEEDRTGQGAAQDSAVIEGVVVEAETGRPLQGALVRVLGAGREDLTHEGGEFHLLNLPAGRHTIVVERLGYRREVREVAVRARETVHVRIELAQSAIGLPGIIVTGTSRPSLGDRSVRPANVVSAQELTRKLDVTLASTLAHEPGLAVTSVGPATARPVIRGLGGDRVLVLEDGGRVGDLSSTSGDHAVAVEPLTAQRIEVVRGPSALLYGSNAIGGVINVIREEVPSTAPERPTGVVSVQGQSVNRGWAAGAMAHGAMGEYALRGEASHRDASDLRTPAGVLDNTGLRSTTLGAGASRVAGWGHAGVAYRFYDNVYGIPGGFVGSHPEGVEIEMRRHSIQGEAHLRRPAGPFDGFDVRGRYTHYHHTELEAPGIVGTEFGLLTASGEVLGRHGEFGALHNGAIGVRVQWRDYAAGGSTATPPAREWSASGFVLEEVEAGRLTLQGGLRYDWHRVEPLDTMVELDIGDVRTRSFGSVSGSLGALVTVSPVVSIGASVARAYRTPDFAELFSQGPHLAAYSFEVGNPDLAAETGLGLDIFARLSAARFRAEIAAFRNRLDNYIHYRPTGATSPTGLPIYQAAGADAVLTGAEATATVEPVRRIAVSGTVSYVRGTLLGEDRPLPAMPPLRGHVTVRYERPGWFIGTTVQRTAAQERVGEFETATPGYTLLDVDAGYRWQAFGRVQSVTLKLDNLLDEAVHDHLSRVKDLMPGPGRGASLIYRVVF